MKKIITYGTYDMLHEGHINILKRAKERGDYLIVGVTSEDYDRSRGKLNVVESQEQRVSAVEALDFVDKVILETHKNQKQEDMIKYNIDEFVIGDDWVGKFDYLNEYTKVVYVPRTEGISSTALREKSVKNISIGIVGANGDSRRFLREAVHIMRIKISSLYDENKKDLKKFKDQYSYINIYEEYNRFLESNIEAVYIASNIDRHYEHIVHALKAGKHVLCENPLAINNKKVKELFKIAKKENKLLLMAMKTAFAPAFNKMLQELDKGTIGKVREVRSTFTSLYKERGFPKRYVANGATNLLMSYPALLVQKVAGKAKNINYFDQRNRDYDTSNRAISAHKKGIIGISTVGIEMKSDGHAVISGTKGYIYIPAPWWLTSEFYIKFEDNTKDIHYEYQFEGDGLRYMIAEFISLIRRDQVESKRLTMKEIIDMNLFIANYNKDKK